MAFGVSPLFLPLAMTAFGDCDHSIWSIRVHCAQILLSLRKNGHEESRLLNLRRLGSSRCGLDPYHCYKNNIVLQRATLMGQKVKFMSQALPPRQVHPVEHAIDEFTPFPFSLLPSLFPPSPLRPSPLPPLFAPSLSPPLSFLGTEKVFQ